MNIKRFNLLLFHIIIIKSVPFHTSCYLHNSIGGPAFTAAAHGSKQSKAIAGRSVCVQCRGCGTTIMIAHLADFDYFSNMVNVCN